MTKLRFKTNLKCNGCIRAITPGLESLNIIEHWSVDLENQDKVLEMEAPEEVSELVITSVKKAGYQISRL
jgi:copper chaperone